VGLRRQQIRRGGKRQLVDRVAEIAGHEVAVHLRGDPRICVSQDALHRERIDAGVEQEAGRGVPLMPISA